MKKAGIITGIVVGVLAILYIAGVVAGGFIFYPNTYVNGIDVSYKNQEDAKELIIPDNSQLSIEKIDGSTENIELSDIDYKIEIKDTTTALQRQQSHFAWPATFFRDTNLSDEYAVTYDETKLQDEIKALEAMDDENVIMPEDAYVGPGENGEYQIVPEIEGNLLDEERTVKEIESVLTGAGFEVNLEKAGCYEKPRITSDDEGLKNLLADVLTLNSETITLDMTGAFEVLDPIRLLELVNIENGQVSINETAMDEYIGYLVETYQTYMSKRSFVTSDKKTIQVGGSQKDGIALDTYGFWMNQEATREVLENAILSLETQTIEPVWYVPAVTRNAKNGDIGDTYVEISLEKQHLWYYEKGKLKLETDVVTGKYSNEEMRTPTGLFRVWDKATDTYLMGQMADDTWNSFVNFWMGVTWTGVGIHDAPWRNAFGGEIYKNGGSHGCINMNYDNAKKLYDMVQYDTPVIIY